MKKLTRNEFISKSKEIHQDKNNKPIYEYNKVEYIGSKNKVIIICKKNEHGEFLQSPNHHLKGNGCPKCGGRLKSNKEEFENKSKLIHENKYDYSKTIYVNSKSKITIICPKHGEFLQSPTLHIRGVGCPRCGGTGKLTQKEFENRAKEKHKDEKGIPKYSYIKASYISAHEKVIIICKKEGHGEFLQKAHDHLRGDGGPRCKYSKGERVILEFFIKNNICNIKNKRFVDCKLKNPLPFDFYIPKYNLCIEYDGRQHYMAINHWGGEKELNKIMIRDQIKNKYCKNNNIRLLRISYLDFEKIEQILENELNIN